MTHSRTPLGAPAVVPPAIQAAGHLGPQDHPASSCLSTRQAPHQTGRGPVTSSLSLRVPACPHGTLGTAAWAEGRPLPAALVWILGGCCANQEKHHPFLPQTRQPRRGGWCAHDSQRGPPPRPTSAAPFPPDRPVSTGSFLPRADHTPTSPGPIQGPHCSGPEPRRPPQRGNSARAVPG